jgi:hypothetical protein
MRRPRLFLCSILIFLIVIPVILAIWYISSYAVNVPYWDQWDMEVWVLDQFMHQQISFSDLIAQHNESRPFFPRIIALGVGILTAYDVRYESWIMFALFLGVFVLIGSMVVKDHGWNTWSLLFLVPVSWFFFNFSLVYNYLFGVRVSQALVITMLVIAILLLDRSERLDPGFFLAAGAAGVATFTFIAGLFVWPACAVLLLLKNSGNKLQMLLAWGGFWVFFYLVYFWGYFKPGQTPEYLLRSSYAVDATLTFMVSVGSSAVHSSTYTLPAGAVVLCLAGALLVYNRKRLDFGRNGKWIAMIAFSLLTSGAVVMARGGWGENVGLAARYYVITFVSIIGIYGLALNYTKSSAGPAGCRWLPGKKSRPSRDSMVNLSLLGLAVVLLCAGAIVHINPGLMEGARHHEELTNGSYLLETYAVQPDGALTILYPNPQSVRSKAKFLQEYNLSVFASQRTDIHGIGKLNATTLSAIDTINGVPVTVQGAPVRVNPANTTGIGISGWAVDQMGNSGAAAVFINLNDQTDVPALTHGVRKDVAAYFHNDNYLYSGYTAFFSTGLLRNGTNSVSLKILDRDGTGYYQSAPVSLVFST